jgi:hypothetical protein
MSTPYIQPVILWEDAEAAKKARTILIYKSEVFKDIDLYTHKHVDAREDMGPRSSNAVSSDTSETVDHAVIDRYVKFRDSQLRVKMQSVLLNPEAEGADDILPEDDNIFYYNLEVNDTVRDNVLNPLAEYIHRFLVFGALYDWYSMFGDLASQRLAQNYKQQADDAEDLISGILRGPSIAKRPMQPFGPAEKIYP